MNQFRCNARLSAITVGLLLAGCGDGQQSDLATKMKALMGGQSASPPVTTEPDPQQARQSKLNDLLKKAEAGNVLAMVEAGRAYEEGRYWGSAEHIVDLGSKDSLIDLDKAADWYEKAAGMGNAEGQYRLGKLLEPSAFSDLIPMKRQRDRAKAVEWLEKAAKQNHPDALVRLGRLYDDGNGVMRDKWVAFQNFMRAAELGNADAQFEVGLRYFQGAPQDPQGKCTHRYLSDDPNYGKGNYFDKFDAPFCLADKNVAAAVEWWQKAAAQGNWTAQFNLAGLYRSGEGVAKDSYLAYTLYEAVAKLAEKKDGFIPLAAFDAQAVLGAMYSVGEGVPKDDAKAVEWYQRAASSGQASAQQNLGVAYLRGEGVATDNVLAYAWSNLAGGQGKEGAGKNRDIAARRMTPAEIAEAQRLSSGWKVGVLLARESGSAGSGKQPATTGSLAKKGTGTAFIVNAAGHAITNHHVVDGCTEVRAEGRDGVVKVVTSDVVNDLAQLQIPGVPSAQATIASDPAKLRQGEDIVVFGFPLNAVLSSGGNLTPGVVSALTGLGNNTNQIQITAPIQPGSSGSPVINKKGEVVGVVAMKLSDSKMAKATGQVGQNVNFAVSGQTLKTFLDTHKVEYRSGGMFSFGGKNTADLADEARKWTLVVECWK
ncbi:MAG: tetratricopeptide repeat-containing serine protease family protein [Rhodocyclaceae bacterium]|jgi:TPR repeat protein|nr:tetratricopeptide repeat-containing serine protease family protein [Rhodocyclaceae bacterium]